MGPLSLKLRRPLSHWLHFYSLQFLGTWYVLRMINFSDRSDFECPHLEFSEATNGSVALKASARSLNRELSDVSTLTVSDKSYVLLEAHSYGGILRITDTDYSNYSIILTYRKVQESVVVFRFEIINCYLRCRSFIYGSIPIYYLEPFGIGQGQCTDGKQEGHWKCGQAWCSNVRNN